MRPVTWTMGGTDARAASGGPMRAANNRARDGPLRTARAGPPARRSGLESGRPAPSAGPMPSRRAGRGVGVRARRRRSAAPTGRAREGRRVALDVGAIDRKKAVPTGARRGFVRDRARGGVPRRGGPARRGRARLARARRGRRPRAATFAVAARRRASAATARRAGPSSTKPKNGKMETSKPAARRSVGARHRPGRWRRPATPRFCCTSPAPHCARCPESHHAVKSAAALAGVRGRLLAAHEKRRRKNAGGVRRRDRFDRSRPPGFARRVRGDTRRAARSDAEAWT